MQQIERYGVLALLLFLAWIALLLREFLERLLEPREPVSPILAAVFLLKSLLPAMALNLLLQGVAETLRSILVLVEGE